MQRHSSKVDLLLAPVITAKSFGIPNSISFLTLVLG